jgi:hypothetical protein
MRAALLAGPLAELMTDSLMAPGSFEAHRGGVKFELEVLGCLLTMER